MPINWPIQNASLGRQIALERDRIGQEKLLKLRTQGLDLEYLEEYIGALDANKLANTNASLGRQIALGVI